MWALALTFDLLGAYVGGGKGWRLSAGHFAERHALIVIIALGESIVALGVAASHELGPGRVVAAVARPRGRGRDVVALLRRGRDRGGAEAARRLTGNARAAMARDSYSYLHLPMVAGIILFAVGVKKTFGDVGDPLKLVPAVTLCGGVALYLLAHILFRLRNVGSLNRQRLVVTVALLALIPLGVELAALVTLTLVAALCIGLIAYEAIRFADARDRVRHARPEPASRSRGAGRARPP